MTENNKLLEEMKDTSWERFLGLTQQGKHSVSHPRKTVYLDADLHKGLKELKIPVDCSYTSSINTLVNAIVRAFIEVNSVRLKPYRKQVDVQSVFDNI